MKDEAAYLHGGNIPAKMKGGSGDVKNIAIETVTDISALSAANMFVGTFTSDFGRLVFELVSARALDHVPPHVSLAGTFCGGKEFISKRKVYCCE